MREILMDMSTDKEVELFWFSRLAMTVVGSTEDIELMWSLQHTLEKPIRDMEEINIAYKEMIEKINEFTTLIKARVVETIAINACESK